MENQASLLLDHLDLAVLGLSAELKPVFLSSRAAKLLLLRERTDLEEFTGLLSPLIDFCRREQSRTTLAASTKLEELSLSAKDGRRVSVLAYSRPVTGREPFAFAVVFFDRAPFDPFFALLDQGRRLRAGIVLSSALIGMPLGDAPLDEIGASLKSGLLEPGSEAAQHGSPRVVDPVRAADLMGSITLALEIVDRLIMPSFKITVEGSCPALLKPPRVPVLRILSHALLEATDFGGPFGRARISAFLGSESARLLVLGSRMESLPTELHPLELYLVRKSMPSEYRVVRGELRDDFSPLPQEELAFLERFVGKERLSPVHLQGVIPNESFSENLRLATYLGRPHGVELEARLIPPHHILVTLVFPLAG